MKKKGKILCYSTLATAILAFVLGFIFYNNTLLKVQPIQLSEQELNENDKIISSIYPTKLLNALPYNVTIDELPINAKSAIIVDANSGSILFEKDSYLAIPPASMTKLVVMYLALEQVKNGTVKLDDIVPLTKESWAKNAPPHSSLMFLGENQTVTLDELLTGMAVVSGNDAAFATAIYICGSIENCVTKMNDLMNELGLVNTHFVEVSGYSEKNTTNAKEFAAFSRMYITKFPQALEKYHSVKSLTYPKKRNLAPGINYEDALVNGIPLEGTMPITQKATNRVLSLIDGADGLKTGYIDESGYNLSLTVLRNNTRFISVTMGGPGETSIQGNELRVMDAQTLMNWAFSVFYSEKIPDQYIQNAIVFSGKENALKLIEAKNQPHYLTMPILQDKNESTENLQLQRKVLITKKIKAPISCGEQLGVVEYYLGDYLLETNPLVADRTVTKGNIFKQIYGCILSK